MTRLCIDPLVAIKIVTDAAVVHPDHQLVAPNVLRSQVLSRLYVDMRAGVLSDKDARVILDGVTALRVRVLGDRVSRGTAWRIASELDWPEIGQSEYLAVARLQADALVALDDDLLAVADGVVPLAPFEALLRPSSA